MKYCFDGYLNGPASEIIRPDTPVGSVNHSSPDKPPAYWSRLEIPRTLTSLSKLLDESF